MVAEHQNVKKACTTCGKEKKRTNTDLKSGREPKITRSEEYMCSAKQRVKKSFRI